MAASQYQVAAKVGWLLLTGRSLGFDRLSPGLEPSARSADIRVAQQLSGLAVLPMVILIILFSIGVIDPTVPSFLLAAGVLAAIDVSLWPIVERSFDHDRVLARFGA